jgi:hypothetical protein
MSDPMSNHEIEDVLSSIRRLVSEDLRPTARPVAQDTAGPEKLLLTPALRVVTEPQAEAVMPSESASASSQVEDVVSRLGAAVPEDEWESPFGDPEIWPGSEQVELSDAAAEGYVAPPLQPETGDADDMSAAFLDSPMAAYSDVEDVLASAADAPVTPAREPRLEVRPPQDDRAWAEAAEAAVRADLAQDAEDEVIFGLGDAEAGGMVFDEEVLRDLVRDLIREE